MPSIGTPRRLELASCGASADARHAPAGEDVEQARLARRARSALASPACPAAPAASAKSRQRLADHAASGRCVSAGVAQAASDQRRRTTSEDRQRDPERTARLMRSASSRLAARAARASTPAEQRERAAERDQRAAEPDQGHERLPPQAAAASRPARRPCRSRYRAGRSRTCRDRRFVGLGRRRR